MTTLVFTTNDYQKTVFINDQFLTFVSIMSLLETNLQHNDGNKNRNYLSMLEIVYNERPIGCTSMW